MSDVAVLDHVAINKSRTTVWMTLFPSFDEMKHNFGWICYT